MLKMQVPDGQPAAAAWCTTRSTTRTGRRSACAPHEDPIERATSAPPSTAATLNLAADAAQAARIWKTIDTPFAAKCLAAAERAWAAAAANPAVYAARGGQGGGPYDDDNVSDEFYWAAAELFITTKKHGYKDVHRQVAVLQDRCPRRRRPAPPAVRVGDDVGPTRSRWARSRWRWCRTAARRRRRWPSARTPSRPPPTRSWT